MTDKITWLNAGILDHEQQISETSMECIAGKFRNEQARQMLYRQGERKEVRLIDSVTGICRDAQWNFLRK